MPHLKGLKHTLAQHSHSVLWNMFWFMMLIIPVFFLVNLDRTYAYEHNQRHSVIFLELGISVSIVLLCILVARYVVSPCIACGHAYTPRYRSHVESLSASSR